MTHLRGKKKKKKTGGCKIILKAIIAITMKVKELDAYLQAMIT
jgi:hypothetical protein